MSIIMRKPWIPALLMALAAITACHENSYGPTNHTPEADKPENIVKGSFAEGADISWVTEMERDGMRFYNATGAEFSLTQDNTILFERIRQRNITENHSRICGNHTIDTDLLLSYNKAGNAIISHSESAIFASCHLNRETRTQ